MMPLSKDGTLGSLHYISNDSQRCLQGLAFFKSVLRSDSQFIPGIHELLFQIQSCSDNHSSEAFLQLTDSTAIREPSREAI